MIAFLPPISAMIRFSQIWSGGVLAASPNRWMPTSREPVNAIIRTLECVASASPTTRPDPGITFSTPGGRPASVSASTVS